MKTVKWYHFWNPSSGMLGGAIAGLAILLILRAIGIL